KIAFDFPPTQNIIEPFFSAAKAIDMAFAAFFYFVKIQVNKICYSEYFPDRLFIVFYAVCDCQ
ncbi:hypothetical protein, partial [Enterococcus avium]|uniref:hypothetical protein n=1 Tax=Enterococcus avium TaxID=33945 RepID=UPI000FF44D9F